MTRADIIAQLDHDIVRLERARDYLTTALKGSRIVFPGTIELKVVQKRRKQQPRQAPKAASLQQSPTAVAEAIPEKSAEPEVKRVPPRRRVERRPATAEKVAKSTAALSGAVPAGPVVVSANEARKHERAVPAPVLPPVTELRSEMGAERSLSSLIQAFDRRTGFNGAETP